MSTFTDVLAATSILRRWRLNPSAPRRAYENISWLAEHPDPDKPLSHSEIEQCKATLRRLAPSAFRELFPDDLSPPNNGS
jgi:hypothetical protein